MKSWPEVLTLPIDWIYLDYIPGTLLYFVGECLLTTTANNNVCLENVTGGYA